MIIEDVCRILFLFFKVMLMSFMNYGWWQREDSESSKVLRQKTSDNNKVLRCAIVNIKHLTKQLYLEVTIAVNFNSTTLI